MVFFHLPWTMGSNRAPLIVDPFVRSCVSSHCAILSVARLNVLQIKGQLIHLILRAFVP